MGTKLHISIGVVAALVLLIYMLTLPEEAVAPVEEPIVSSETRAVTEQDSAATSMADSAGTASSPQTTPSVDTQLGVRSSASTSPTLPYSAVVVYTGERFIPNKITVIQGGTVRFVNTSDTQMWIASDNHPTHTRYPMKSESDCAGSSFDQCVAVGNGGSWSFTFTRTGTWGYHNHVRARDTGDIVVRTEKEYFESR